MSRAADPRRVECAAAAGAMTSGESRSPTEPRPGPELRPLPDAAFRPWSMTRGDRDKMSDHGSLAAAHRRVGGAALDGDRGPGARVEAPPSLRRSHAPRSLRPGGRRLGAHGNRALRAPL